MPRDTRTSNTNRYAEIASRNHISKISPRTYLPDIAMILNSLGNLQCAKKEYKKARYSYEESLRIRKHFADLIPSVFEIPLADIYMSLSQLYRYNLINKEKSTHFAKKAVELYEKYWNNVPYAKK